MEITGTLENFEEAVLHSDKTVLVDFWAEWCGPCKMIAPYVEEIAGERSDLTVCKVNVDEQPQLAERYRIQYIPTLMVVRDGAVVTAASGYRDKAGILALLESGK